MTLSPAVELYRKLNGENFSAGKISGTISFVDGAALVGACKAIYDCKIEVDGEYIEDTDPLPKSGEEISFQCSIPTSSNNTFYKDVNALLSKGSDISKGKLPEDFYLVDDDYYCSDAAIPKSVLQLQQVIELIRSLSTLARYHDDKSNGSPRKLVFIPSPGAQYQHPVVLQTQVTQEILSEAADLPATFLAGLVNVTPEEDIHSTARCRMFETTITEFLSPITEATRFLYLIKHWQDFTNQFHNNFNTYLSGFAFHKAKKEVASQELEIAHQFSKVTSEIVGKLFGIPLSVGAVLAMPKSSTLFEESILLFSIVLAALIISGAVGNQQMQFRRIRHSKDIILKDIESRSDDYPADLRSDIKTMKRSLNNDERKLNLILMTFRALCWVPPIFGTYIFMLDHSVAAYLKYLILEFGSYFC